jgi:uncharacterized Zn finger protein
MSEPRDSAREARSVAELVGGDAIARLALPSNLRYGRAIYRRGGVHFTDVNRLKVEGWVGDLQGSVSEGGSQRRRVKLVSTPRGLGWRCTGNPKNHQVFCKHCVALALATLEEARR